MQQPIQGGNSFQKCGDIVPMLLEVLFALATAAALSFHPTPTPVHMVACQGHESKKGTKTSDVAHPQIIHCHIPCQHSTLSNSKPGR